MNSIFLCVTDDAPKSASPHIAPGVGVSGGVGGPIVVRDTRVAGPTLTDFVSQLEDYNPTVSTPHNFHT